MTKPFFIMIYAQSGEGASPMTQGNSDEVQFWATEAEAREVADNHFYASAMGYEIFEMGTGE